MDVIELARKLGAAIQQDERYIKFASAQKESENDAQVTATMGKIDEIRNEYQAEAESENPDDKKLEALDRQFQEYYTSIMENTSMDKYEKAREELDKLMNYIMQILYLSVNGEDPATCEPNDDDDECSGECSTCGGCH